MFVIIEYNFKKSIFLDRPLVEARMFIAHWLTETARCH